MRSKIPRSTSSAWSSRSTRTCAAAPENPASRTPQPTPRWPSAAPVFWSILPIPRKHRAKCWLEFIHMKPAERAMAATNVRSRPVPSHGPGPLPRRRGHALVDCVKDLSSARSRYVEAAMTYALSKKPRTKPGLEFAGDEAINNAPRSGRRSRRSGSSPGR